jgi:hypothetical protein
LLGTFHTILRVHRCVIGVILVLLHPDLYEIKSATRFTRLCKLGFILLLHKISLLAKFSERLVQPLLLHKLPRGLAFLLRLHLLELPQQAVDLCLAAIGLALCLLKGSVQVPLLLDALLLVLLLCILLSALFLPFEVFQLVVGSL